MRFRARTSFLLVVGVVLATLAGACAPRLSDSTPAGALQLFLAAMEESEHDASALARAYELLAPESRRRLAKRAELASSLTRRDFAPWEMLVQGRYRLRFVPRRSHGFVERHVGGRVEVEVLGERPSERAIVPMVAEGRHYRVQLDVPSVDRGSSRRSDDSAGGATPRAE